MTIKVPYSKCFFLYSHLQFFLGFSETPQQLLKALCLIYHKSILFQKGVRILSKNRTVDTYWFRQPESEYIMNCYSVGFEQEVHFFEILNLTTVDEILLPSVFFVNIIREEEET